MRLVFKFLKQRLGFFQVTCIEALGEPAVNLGEHRARVAAFSMLRKWPREAGSRAQLPGFGASTPCNWRDPPCLQQARAKLGPQPLIPFGKLFAQPQ